MDISTGAQPALVASVVAAALATIGVLLAAFHPRFSEGNTGAFTGFAAGLLVAIALLHLLPESIASGPNGPWFVLLGYFVLFTANLVFSGRGDDKGDRRISATAPVLGIAFHSFVDGLEYPILFTDSIFTGLTASIGLILHELAEGVVVFALVRRGGAGVAPAVLLAFMAAAATTPLGALMSIQFVERIDPAAAGVLTSLAAGALFYVGATHLPRHMRRTKKGKVWIYFVSGAALASALTLSRYISDVAHIHGHDADAHEHRSPAAPPAHP